MRIKFSELLFGLLLAFCLVTFVSAGTGIVGELDNTTEIIPADVPEIGIDETDYETNEETSDISDEENLTVSEDEITPEEEITLKKESLGGSKEGSEVEYCLESETTEILIEGSDFNWEGEVTLTKGPDLIYSPTNNLTAEYDVDATSDLAALLKASEEGGFDFYTDDSDYPDYSTFWLTGMDGINNTADWSYYWSVYINGNATESGLSGTLLNDGDLLQFCYGYSDYMEGIFPSPTGFTNIVNITVDVQEAFNWEGEVTLTKGPDLIYSPTNNLTAEYDVDATSDLAALLKASEEGGFDFYTDDSDYPDYSTFWLTGMDGINNTADWSYYWSVYINGNATESGLSGTLLNDGDLLQFCYGYSDYMEGIFPSPTGFTNIVNITVDVQEAFNWESEVTLTKGPDLIYSPTNNLTAEYDVDATSDLAALLKASEDGGFDFYTDDSDYPDYSTFWLTGIDGINNTADWSYYWSVYINGNATESGLSGTLLNDGDLLQFCYGYSDYMEGIFPSPTGFTNIVNITVDVQEAFNWESEVTLTKGPDIKYSPTTNLTAEYDVDVTSDLAALLKASEDGGFDFYTDDSDYPDYSTFWLTGIDGINNTADWSYYWSVYINGNATESGLSGTLLNDGDLLQFCYGYSDYMEGIFPSPTGFTNIVNITVNIEEYNGMAMLLPSEGMMENTSYTTQITVSNITSASGLNTILTWNPDVIEVFNITANKSVFSGLAVSQNITSGRADVVLTCTGGITATSPEPVFDVEFRSKTGLHEATIMSGTDTQYSDMSFINYDLPCGDGYFIIERIKGDFNENNIVDIGDVSRVAYMVADKAPIDMEADFNENGRIDVGDAAAIAWFFIGKSVEL